MLHVQRDLKIHYKATNVVYEVLEASIPKEKLAEWLSLALDPETGQVGDTDGGLWCVCKSKKWDLGFYLIAFRNTYSLLEITTISSCITYYNCINDYSSLNDKELGIFFCYFLYLTFS